MTRPAHRDLAAPAKARALSFATLCLLACCCSGCAVLMPLSGHEGGSASLSDAIAQDSTRKVRPLDVGHTTPPVVEVAPVEAAPEPPPPPEPSSISTPAELDSAAAASGADSLASAPDAGIAPGVHAPAAPKKEVVQQPILIGLVGAGGALGGRIYDGYGFLGISVGGFVGPHLRVDGIASFGGFDFTDESVLGHHLKDPIELNLDVAVRYYPTAGHTFMGLYALAGAGTGTLFWSYATPVLVEEDGELKKVDTDQLNHFSLFGGAGISLVQTRHLHVGTNLVGGVRFYGWHTGSGLRNDMLKTTGFFRVAVEAQIQFVPGGGKRRH